MTWPRLLLFLPYIAVLLVPLYNRSLPDIAGIPLFYWYQLLWIPLGSLLLLLAYKLDASRRKEPR
jgi:hypothetical protein